MNLLPTNKLSMDELIVVPKLIALLEGCQIWLYVRLTSSWSWLHSVSTVSSASSVNSVNSANNANSVSSLGGGATSASDVIFMFRSIITQVADTWRKQEENQAKVGFTNYSATDGQPSHTLLLGTSAAFHFSDH